MYNKVDTNMNFVDREKETENSGAKMISSKIHGES